MKNSTRSLALALADSPGVLPERLDGAVFCGAELRERDLRGLVFEGADLRGADLRGTDLRGASFCFAALDGADLRGARLEGAHFYGAYGRLRVEAPVDSQSLRAEIELTQDDELPAPGPYLPQQRSLMSAGWRYRVLSWPAVDEALPPLVALHGMTGLARDFSALADHWAGALHAIEILGHGESELVPPGALRGAQVIAQLRALCERLTAGQSWGLIGYSMGGRLAAQLLVTLPPRLGAAVFLGSTPGLEGETARSERRAADLKWVELLREEGIDAFLQRWDAQPILQRGQQLDKGSYLQRLLYREGHKAEGICFALQELGLGALPSCWESLRGNTVPQLWVSGADDLKFCEIGARAAALSSDGRAAQIAGCGHNPLLEVPERLAELVIPFLIEKLTA